MAHHAHWPRRRGTVASAVLVLGLAAARPANAQFAGMQVNGTAFVNASGRLVLTPASGGDGSAFATTPVATSTLRSFAATFDYFIGGGSGADGLAFVVRGGGPGALGGAGGGIGYFGLPNSVGALYRTYVYNVVQAGTNGDFNGSSAGATTRGTHAASVAYDATTQILSIGLDGTTLVNQGGIDLASLVGPQAYFGFTAATGGATDEHRIDAYTLSIVTTASAVPEPATVALTATGLALVALGARRRRR